MTDTKTTDIRQELDELHARVAQLERELAASENQTVSAWPKIPGYYWTYYATTGFFLGMIGACTSLLFNVVGSVLVNQHPLHLIKIYLTFGMGERAVAPGFDDGLALVVGCCLYIATGMLLGVPFQLILSRYASQTGLLGRLAVASALAILVWLVNYYAVLFWLQPLLFGGNWIVHDVPAWVAALTHLVFGWTMAVIFPWGLYEPYRVRTE